MSARAAGDISVKPKPQFAELLRSVGAVPGISRVRFVSPHPKDMREDTLLAMAETSTVVEHLHYPMQSGSDNVLALMHRGYTAERYLKRLEQARTMINDLAVTTDVIVGFPGESEQDFLQTVEACAEACFDSAFSFIFSPRPGTQAAEMTDKFIDEAVAVERYERLKIVLDHSAVLKHRERIGRIEEVVVEGMSRKNPELTTGRTRQNKILHFSSPQSLRVGTYAKVEVTAAARFHLSGQLVEVGEAPKHKLRLAVSSAN
jgi:tRNA-2-methylthio-N6-dimethylallyladenosine synthase